MVGYVSFFFSICYRVYVATCVCVYAHVYGICLQLRLLTGRSYSFGCDVLSAVQLIC